MLTILVVDDTEACRRLLARLLRAKGYETLCVSNGLEALEALKMATPALILLDLAMPELDGIGFLRAIRDRPEWAAVPVIVVSGEEANSPLRRAEELGARDVFVKARFAPSQLLAAIQRHLSN